VSVFVVVHVNCKGIKFSPVIVVSRLKLVPVYEPITLLPAGNVVFMINMPSIQRLNEALPVPPIDTLNIRVTLLCMETNPPKVITKDAGAPSRLKEESKLLLQIDAFKAPI
jgi:hypothetical protein